MVVSSKVVMVIFWINPNIFDFFVNFFVIVFGPEKTGGPNKLGVRENQISGEGGGMEISIK